MWDDRKSRAHLFSHGARAPNGLIVTRDTSFFKTYCYLIASLESFMSLARGDAEASAAKRLRSSRLVFTNVSAPTGTIGRPAPLHFFRWRDWMACCSALEEWIFSAGCGGGALGVDVRSGGWEGVGREEQDASFFRRRKPTLSNVVPGEPARYKINRISTQPA